MTSVPRSLTRTFGRIRVWILAMLVISLFSTVASAQPSIEKQREMAELASIQWYVSNYHQNLVRITIEHGEIPDRVHDLLRSLICDLEVFIGMPSARMETDWIIPPIPPNLPPALVTVPVPQCPDCDDDTQCCRNLTCKKVCLPACE